ncbi:MAG: HAMP domain-containing sensor histidine kinase [Terracidiphilus sp.]|nr:HAMP domain-containing sensor histidine kinase [Terracidiphilus sp.]
MPDYYHAPCLALIALLLPAFGYLYLRFRDTRTLLWFLGFLFAVVRMLLYYPLGWWSFSTATSPWMQAASQTSILISSALFLASLSPLRFRVGRFNVLYAIPYIAPLVAYSILLYGVFHGIAPQAPLNLIFPALGMFAFVPCIFWAVQKGNLPTWLSAGYCTVLGLFAFVVFFTLGPAWPLNFIEAANLIMTALLLVFTFRRFSPGVVLSTLGFTAWSLAIFQILPAVASNPGLQLILIRIIVMGKVVAALGMILLVLEDELDKNKAAGKREHRARVELEAYSKLILSRRRVEDFDHQCGVICETVTAHSRFTQAALLIESAGRYRLAGSAGLDTATATALDALAARIPAAAFLTNGSAPPAVDHSQTRYLDLTPWLIPGDDLKRLAFTAALAVPMAGRTATEGALLLSELHNPHEPLRADDLLPVEMLTARLQAVRSQTSMLEKLIDSEKFAGLGQLAGNVSQQLNNPLTVILGYASLLEETSSLDPQERKGIESILCEARRMRSTLESLSRIARHQNDQLAAVSVTEMLADMEELHRSELLRRSIEFRLSIAPDLPRVLCHTQQLRQAVLHCLQFAIAAVERQGPAPNEARSIRLEATCEGSMVQILIAHSGACFTDPERAFDPFVPAQASEETAGLGLSLCATILREHNGRASAVNLEPRGAAILLELQSA